MDGFNATAAQVVCRWDGRAERGHTPVACVPGAILAGTLSRTGWRQHCMPGTSDKEGCITHPWLLQSCLGHALSSTLTGSRPLVPSGYHLTWRGPGVRVLLSASFFQHTMLVTLHRMVHAHLSSEAKKQMPNLGLIDKNQ